MSNVAITCHPRKLIVLSALLYKIGRTNVLIESIDVEEHKITIVGNGLNALSFYLMDYPLVVVGPNNTHVFIDTKEKQNEDE